MYLNAGTRVYLYNTTNYVDSTGFHGTFRGNVYASNGMTGNIGYRTSNGEARTLSIGNGLITSDDRDYNYDSGNTYENIRIRVSNIFHKVLFYRLTKF